MANFKTATIKTATPICKRCIHVFFFKKGKIFKTMAGALCSAQGYRNTSGVYNTHECRFLYTDINKNIIKTEEVK